MHFLNCIWESTDYVLCASGCADVYPCAGSVFTHMHEGQSLDLWHPHGDLPVTPVFNRRTGCWEKPAEEANSTLKWETLPQNIR